MLVDIGLIPLAAAIFLVGGYAVGAEYTNRLRFKIKVLTRKLIEIEEEKLVTELTDSLVTRKKRIRNLADKKKDSIKFNIEVNGN